MPWLNVFQTIPLHTCTHTRTHYILDHLCVCVCAFGIEQQICVVKMLCLCLCSYGVCFSFTLAGRQSVHRQTHTHYMDETHANTHSYANTHIYSIYIAFDLIDCTENKQDCLFNYRMQSSAQLRSHGICMEATTTQHQTSAIVFLINWIS